MSMFFGSAKIMAQTHFIKGKTLILPPPWLGRSSSWKNHALPSIPSKIARERESLRVSRKKEAEGQFLSSSSDIVVVVGSGGQKGRSWMRWDGMGCTLISGSVACSAESPTVKSSRAQLNTLLLLPFHFMGRTTLISAGDGFGDLLRQFAQPIP